MEGFLLMLDVFFMILLALGVVRLGKGKDKGRGLGFFAYSEKRMSLKDKAGSNTRA